MLTADRLWKRDPEIHQTTNGNQWYYRFADGFAYGMKDNASVYKDARSVSRVVTSVFVPSERESAKR